MADETNRGGRGQQDEDRLIPEEEIAEDGQVYVNRDNIDFDPEEGLYSGTAVRGGTEIPGPHEQVDDQQADRSGDGDRTDQG